MRQILVTVIFPLIVGALLVATITKIVYYEGKRENLISLGETFIIENSLPYAIKKAKNLNKITVISADDLDFIKLNRSKSTHLNDLDLKAYAKVIKRVLNFDPLFIYVNFLHYAHDEHLIVEFLESFVSHPLRGKIYFSIPVNIIAVIPSYINEKVNLVQNFDCVYEVNSYCTFKPEWENWTPQIISDRLWLNRSPYEVTDNLPHKYPNFILNLPTLDKIDVLSFSKVNRSNINPSLFKDRAVFIGNDIFQSEQFKNSKILINKTYIASSPVRENLSKFGIPYHIFFARMAQMFIDGTTIAVPSRMQSYLTTVLLCSIIVLLLTLYGPIASVASFLIYTFVYPFINIFLLKFFHSYLPMLETIYWGFITFISSNFIYASYTNYISWRQTNLHHSILKTADLKNNFISLISHNLNTPIAKISGILDVLAVKQPNLKLLNLRIKVNLMLLTVRSVLLNTALEEKKQMGNLIRFSDFLIENKTELVRFSRKIGIDLKINSCEIDKHVDSQLTMHFLKCCLSLHKNFIGHINMNFANTLDSLYIYLLLKDYNNPLELEEKDDFFKHSFLNLLKTAHHNNAMDVKNLGADYQVEFVLQVSPIVNSSLKP